VPVLAFSGLPVVDLLADLPTDLGIGLKAGPSLQAWSSLMALALDLVQRGRVLPEFVADGKDLLTRWRPLPEEADRAFLRRLAETLPGLCRAGYREADPGQAPAAGALVMETLEAFTDLALRRALQDYRFTSAGKGAEAAWLASLVEADGRAEGAAKALAGRLPALERWLAPVWAAQSCPFRLCFRLAEGGQPCPWRLEFLLQAEDDPSLLVPAAQVWAGGKALKGALGRKLARPDEFFLGELGRALRVFPALARALKSSHPESLDLDPSGAMAFLQDSAAILEASGFRVQVPNWWRNPVRLSAKLAARPKEKKTSSGLLGLDSLCEFQWKVSLGDQELSLKELMDLAKLKQPLVQVRGQWVILDPAQLQAALDQFRKRGMEGEMTARDLLRLGLGLERGPQGLEVQGVEAQGWLGDLMGAWDDRKLKAVPAPRGLKGQLRPYQSRGLGWLSFLGELGLGGCLADDMGLGKTIQTLAWLLRRRKDPGLPPALLVCPVSLVGNWHREAARFAPGLQVQVHHGAGRKKAGSGLFQGVDLVLTTYQLLASDQDLLKAHPWDALILDEAQHVKNAEALARKAAAGIQAPHRFALSGTPVENRLSELWSILDLLNPGLLGTAAGFRTAFALPIETYRDQAKSEQLKRFTAPFILRRLKTDTRIIQDLPEKVEMKVHCTLSREQASLYQATVQDMVAQVEAADGIQRKGLILSTLMKLKQICNHPAQFLQDGSSIDGRSGKLDALEEILEEILEAGERALVFTQFREMGDLLAKRLEVRFGDAPLFLHGATPKAKRDAMVAAFQAGTGSGVFLLSLKAGGVGLNLTAANHVIHFDRWWNPAVENQATDRAFRIGQTRNVQVRKFICSGTLEDKIDALIESKRELAESVVGSGERWLTELDTRSFRELVALGREAFGAGAQGLPDGDAPRAAQRARKAALA
jgi:non-specific serine/threonine protein kinase